MNITISNLVPVTAQPKAGQRVIQIAPGKWIPVGLGGAAMEFYKCASVDTVNFIWTGYKAVLSAGVYSFESTVTSGLTYGSGYTPEVGKIYDNGALVVVSLLWNGIPQTGLIRHAPMSASAATDDLGNTLTTSGTPTFAVDSGIPCAAMAQTSYIGYTNAITSLSSYTLSIWLKRANEEGIVTLSGGNMGHGGNEVWILWNTNSQILIGDGEADYIYYSENTYTGWQHICLVWTGSVFRLYIGGIQQGSDIPYDYYSSGSLYAYMNSLQRATDSVRGDAKYAAFRLYDRVLNASEIAALAAEFTPTT